MRPRRPPKKASPAPQGRGIRFQWTGFRPMYDFWGHELKRFYQLDTLASATERFCAEQRRFVVSSVRSVLGPGPLSSLHFHLFQEGRYQLIFQLKAVNAKGERASFAFVAAKNHKECSDVARKEHFNLRWLHARAPGYVVQPFGGGPIYLPDRHRRPEHGREVYCYLTQWLQGFDELGVNKDLQFIVNVEKRHTFTIAETELLKGRAIEIIARTYDPEKRMCMAMPEIASGDFVVHRAAAGGPRLKLIACRHLEQGVTPARLMTKLLKSSWEWGGRRFYLAPNAPETLIDALRRAVGAEMAAAWMEAFFAEGRRAAAALPDREYESALRAATRV